MRLKTTLWPAVIAASVWMGGISTAVVKADVSVNAPGGVSVSVDAAKGAYRVTEAGSRWTFSGAVGAPLSDVNATTGRDLLGSYRQISFHWSQDMPMVGTIRDYQQRDVVLFGLEVPKGAGGPLADFPSFTTFPRGLHALSYADSVFSPPKFGLANTSTPWFLFDDAGHTAAFSPASEFLVSAMHGDGVSALGSGVVDTISSFPAGFAHDSVLVFGRGIGETAHAWGDVLTTLSGKPRPADDADTISKYFGYWTDNGASYYYHYDKTLGYTGTLLALRRHYREENIPLRYLQLDSWWYQKSATSYDGKPARNLSSVAAQSWNTYGGTIDYTAAPELFPDGLAAFQKKVDLPLVVHARWLDPNGPYAQKYKLSGVVSIDPRWWDERMAYLKDNGVICYEQDWLNEIYTYSPEMATKLGIAAAFTDNMARSAQANGLTLQYCMGTPRFFLEGTHYKNLTTSRVSNDRFTTARWNNFLYTSLFADALHVRPWCDVFKSTEAGNLVLSTLSTGPVGIGDAIGSESRDNILRAVRLDGVIVKPDAPLLPTDASILSDAKGEHTPLIASAYTDNGVRTAYVFAYERKEDSSDISFKPAELGLAGKVYVYNTADGIGKLQDASVPFTDVIGMPKWSLYIVAPVGGSGIAFLGDEGKIAATGRQRIASVSDESGRMVVTVLMAPGEQAVTLHGFASALPKVSVVGGGATPAAPVGDTGEFATTISAPAAAHPQIRDGDPVNTVTVTFQTHAS